MKTSMILAVALVALIGSVKASDGCCGPMHVSRATWGQTTVNTKPVQGQWPSFFAVNFVDFDMGVALQRVSNFTFGVELYTRRDTQTTQLYMPEYNYCINVSYVESILTYHQLCVGAGSKYPLPASGIEVGSFVGSPNAVFANTWGQISPTSRSYFTVVEEHCTPFGQMQILPHVVTTTFWNMTTSFDNSVFNVPTACSQNTFEAHSPRQLRELSEIVSAVEGLAERSVYWK